MGLQFGNSAVLRKMEYPLAIIIPRSNMSWSGDKVPPMDQLVAGLSSLTMRSNQSKCN